MQPIAIQLFHFASAASLLVVPGLILLIPIRGGSLPARMIVPATFILSPACLALELAVAALARVPFDAFATWVGVVNLGVTAIALMYWRPRLSLNVPLAWLVTAALIVAPVAAVIVATPQLREFGWHNMMQLAAIHEIYALPRPPEELDLAGMGLNYGWLGWAQIALIGKLTGAPTTLLYLPMSVADFVCLFIFLCESSNAVFPAKRATTIVGVSTAVALLSAGALDIILGMTSPAYWPHGEFRVTPMVQKFANMDLMADGIPALALVGYAMIKAVRSRDIDAARLMAIASFAASVTYPLFLPSCVSIAAAFLGFAALASRLPQWRYARYSWSELATTAVLWVVCLGSVAAYILFLGRNTATSPVALRPFADLPQQAVKLAWVFAVIDALLLVIVIAGRRTQSGVLLLTLVVSLGLQAAFVIFSMPLYVEYKFTYSALIVAVPVISAGLAAWAHNGVGRRNILAGVFALFFAGCLVEDPRWREPNLKNVEPIVESALRPRLDWDTSWMRAVREQTPADTILLTGQTNRPIAVFTGRALYVCVNLPQGDVKASARAGYSMSCSTELVDVKSYSADEVQHRASILNIALGATISETDALSVMNDMKRFGRPIAVHTQAQAGFRAWLEQHRIGHAIFTDDSDVIWLIDRTDFPTAGALLPLMFTKPG